MAIHTNRFLLSLSVILILAMAVSSCGRRGALERPPDASVITVDENGQEVEEEPAADKPFILDPLL